MEVMVAQWEVEFTDGFGEWWGGLDESTQASGSTSRWSRLRIGCTTSICGKSRVTTMPKKYSQLRAMMSPAARAESAEIAATLRKELPLHQLRQALKLSQEQVAEELGVTQAAVSRLEHRPDLFVSTLRRFIEAMGGELEVRAHFPTGTVTLADLGMPGHEAT